MESRDWGGGGVSQAVAEEVDEEGGWIRIKIKIRIRKTWKEEMAKAFAASGVAFGAAEARLGLWKKPRRAGWNRR